MPVLNELLVCQFPSEIAAILLYYIKLRKEESKELPYTTHCGIHPS
ncbi:hypothetical protein [uncultured Carboxylicivirga sp.]|nr:hypothetical protein [uncultured Carboxylicivirga sp.]